MRWRIGLGAAFAVVVLVLLLWDWNWFRGGIEAWAAEKLERPVRLGHFDIKLALTPKFLFDRVTIENPDGMTLKAPMLQVQHVDVAVDLGRLWHGVLRMKSIIVEHPDVWLERDMTGRANWDFAKPGGPPVSASSKSFPEIGSLTLNDGKIRFIDPKLKSDETMTAKTVRDPAHGEARIEIDGVGQRNGSAETFHFRGGSVLSLRDKDRPYPLDVVATYGDTKTHLRGTVMRPLEMSGFEADLELSGPDLAALYPLTGIALPPTPPYDLRGVLTFVGHVYAFHKFAGTLGASDLGGSLSFEPKHDAMQQPMLIADLISKRIALSDLRGLIGAPPGKLDAPNTSEERKREAVIEKNSGRLLPAERLDFEKLHAMNADVRYHADHIAADYTPLDNLDARLTLTNGRLQLLPLTFGVGSGSIKLDIDIDSGVDPAAVDVDADFRQVELGRLMQGTNLFNGAGRIGGSGVFKLRGDSMAEMFATGDGDLKLFMGHGEISQILVAVGKFDILQTLGLLTKVEPTDRPNGNTDIRCMIDDMALEHGVLKIRTFVLDTASTNFGMSGSADMHDETLDFVFTPNTKNFGIMTYRPPFIIKGTFAHPNLYPEPIETGARLGASIALGAIATPLAALLPSITLGLGEDADCVGLIKSAVAGAEKNDARSSAKRAEKQAPQHPKLDSDRPSTRQK